MSTGGRVGVRLPTVPVLLLDLDNTLVDRAAAWAAMAGLLVAEHGGDAADLEWMITVDGDGFRPREVVAAAIADRFGIADADDLLALLRAGLVEQMTLMPGAAEALSAAREAGWTLGIVTNGTHAQQSRKIDQLGLDELVDAWVISESAGVRKPDPAIFAIASDRLGRSLDNGWMIGDSAEADIAGGQAAGLRTVWLSRDRRWPGELAEPTMIASSLVEAITTVLDSGPRP
jgi:putative hydrolase of the HAD superfamily